MSFAALTAVFPGLRRKPAVPSEERLPAPEMDPDWPRCLADPGVPQFIPAPVVELVDGPVPAHSEACYCAVIPVDLLPCGNCRSEGFAPVGGA